MRLLSRAVGALFVIGIFSSATLAWRHHARQPEPNPNPNPNPNLQVMAAGTPGEEACDTGTEACGAHRAGDVKAAAKVTGHPRMLAFSSESCPACKRMKPRLEEAMKACNGDGHVDHVNVDGDEGGSLAATYDVSLLPSFVNVDASGGEVSRLTGVQPVERLEHAIEEIRAERCAFIEKPSDEKPM